MKLLICIALLVLITTLGCVIPTSITAPPCELKVLPFVDAVNLDSMPVELVPGSCSWDIARTGKSIYSKGTGSARLSYEGALSQYTVRGAYGTDHSNYVAFTIVDHTGENNAIYQLIRDSLCSHFYVKVAEYEGTDRTDFHTLYSNAYYDCQAGKFEKYQSDFTMRIAVASHTGPDGTSFEYFDP